MRSCFAICLLFLFVHTVAAQKRAVSLADFIDRDIRQLDAESRSRFVDLFRNAANDPNALNPSDIEFVPYKLHMLKTPRPQRLFIEIAPGFQIPGFCGLRVHWFDSRWKRTSTDAFSTGYRKEITEVTFKESRQVEGELVVIKTISAGPWVTDPDGSRKPAAFRGEFRFQYYACISGVLMIVRREDERGHLVLSNYANWTVPEVGMNHPTGTPEALCQLLESGTKAEKLALLVWLTGEHLPSNVKRVGEGASQETVEAAKQYEAVLNCGLLKPTVHKLRESENVWIREYAKLVPVPFHK